jgi:hypothetical protein
MPKQPPPAAHHGPNAGGESRGAATRDGTRMNPQPED